MSRRRIAVNPNTMAAAIVEPIRSRMAHSRTPPGAPE
jgi:hypothetical protein